MGLEITEYKHCIICRRICALCKGFVAGVVADECVAFVIAVSEFFIALLVALLCFFIVYLGLS